MDQTVKRLLLLLTWACAGPVCANEIAADTLLRAATREVISTVERDREIQSCNPARMTALVEARILPHFDLGRMTQDALARNWRPATLEQKNALKLEFRTLLVQTYVTALLTYRDHPVEFKRLRAAPGDTEVTVRSLIKRPGLEPLSVDYEMERQKSEWKVFDIKIASVSLVAAYREAFAATVRTAGIDGLITSLAEKNRQNGQRPADFRFDPYERENFPLMFAIVQSLMQAVR